MILTSCYEGDQMPTKKMIRNLDKLVSIVFLGAVGEHVYASDDILILYRAQALLGVVAMDTMLAVTA